MNLQIQPNKLYNHPQSIYINESILMLIGGNGSGKSAILEKIFEQNLEGQNRVVCYTSGLNESFSPIFNQYFRKKKKKIIEASNEELDGYFNSFYFNSDWAKMLIFFSTILRKDGRVRQFLKSKNYCIESNDGLRDDISTKLELSLRIKRNYMSIIKNALVQEERDFEFQSIRRTIFHRLLTGFVECFQNYDFEDSITKRRFQLNSNTVINAFGGASPNDIFTFLSIANKNSDFINVADNKLLLANGLNISSLSDGEFQMIVVYAILDLFDAPNTIFILDEIDSHLHFENVNKLWQSLNSIRGKILTTTHSADSIIFNKPDTIKLVTNGKIDTLSTPQEIFNRMKSLSGGFYFSFNVMANYEYVALIENKFDWFVFKELCTKKEGEESLIYLDKIATIARSSNYDNPNTPFAKSKIDWVRKFFDINTEYKTKHIFLICDRDNLLENEIKNLVPTGRAKNEYNNGFDQNQKKRVNLNVWNRREIENYLISHTMLTSKNKLNDIQKLIPPVSQIVANSTNENKNVRECDVKSIISSLYLKEGYTELDTHEEGVDYDKLKEVISLIPVQEISDDITTMYNIIKQKIDQN